MDKDERNVKKNKSILLYNVDEKQKNLKNSRRMEISNGKVEN